MKRVIRLFAVAGLVSALVNVACAQTSRQEKRAAEQAGVKKMVDGNHFYFVAEYALPMTGGDKYLTSIYDLKVTKDSIIAFLPYYGAAYIAPSPAEALDGGIKFTSTKFSFAKNERKKGGWVIMIKPQDHDITNWRDVQQLRLDISQDGYASLAVISSNRDPISFQGNIVEKE
ncbi:MAG TPA: DUF4251 domain-containing protein [Mucilaginibacter sp.]|jgi:hypothetical protein|nr:DUF4251 domain-containing protein [Mucilaginibacter sp.]